MNFNTHKLLGSMLVLFILSVSLSGCDQATTSNEVITDVSYYTPYEKGVKTGGVKMIPITTPNGTFNVWTKTIGHNPTARLLLLNGGPGATHEYFECMESFLPQENIEIIYYDQLGCGNSDNPNNTAMWDLARYVEEVEQVRTALNLDATNFYLLGHSWGGILAMEYALKYQQNLKGLIISNMMADAVAYGKYADEVLGPMMDPTVLSQIREIEAKGDFENPKYMELLMPNFYAKHVCRLPLAEWPEPLTRSLNKINQSLYVTMQGPSEFGIGGKLATWNRMADLEKITVPTLVIGATHDTMDPAFMKKMADNIPDAQFLLCPNGSHMCMYDDQEVYHKGLIDFIKSGDKDGKQKMLRDRYKEIDKVKDAT